MQYKYCMPQEDHLDPNETLQTQYWYGEHVKWRVKQIATVKD